MVVTVETDRPDRIGEAAPKTSSSAGNADRQEPVPIEAIWQEALHRVVLSAGT